MPTNCDNEWFVGQFPVTKAYWGETQVYPCADDPGPGPLPPLTGQYIVKWKPEAVGKEVRIGLRPATHGDPQQVNIDMGDGVFFEKSITGLFTFLLKGTTTRVDFTGADLTQVGVWLNETPGHYIEDVIELPNQTMLYTHYLLGSVEKPTSLIDGSFTAERLTIFDREEQYSKVMPTTNPDIFTASFRGTPNFNQDLSCLSDLFNSFNTSNGGVGTYIFADTKKFNQPLDFINTPFLLKTGDGLFMRAEAFNQDLTHLDASLCARKPYNFDNGATAWNGIGMGPDRSGRDEGHPEWGRPLWGTTGVL